MTAPNDDHHPDYDAYRRVQGCPWDAPASWFVNLVFWMAWRSKRPLRAQEGHGQARTRLKATRAQRDRTYQRDGYRCVFCRTSDNLTVDHVIPVVFGGNNHDDNLRTMCTRCNGRHFAEHHKALLNTAALAPKAAA